MPRGNEHILFSIYERLAGHFVLKFKTIRFLWEKDRCAVLRCNDGCLFPEKYTVKDHISNTKQVHVQCILLMSLRRPIILLI